MNPPRSQRHLLVRGGILVTMDRHLRVIEEDLLITDGRIAGMGKNLNVPPATRLLDASGMVILPGLIQGHVHLGQTLFRGLAEDMGLLDWLARRIWPLEAAHTEESAYWSAMAGAADCLLSGTTTVHDIGLVYGMEGVFRGILDSGIRGIAGKCLMDAGEGAPSLLKEETAVALETAADLIHHWDGEAEGRIRGAVCPRFALSCSPALWEGAVSLAREHDLNLHTHLLECREEEAAVAELLGKGQMEFLDGLGVFDLEPVVAHGVLLDEPRLEILDGRHLGVIHCPSANAKLGSGIADLALLRKHENVALGIGCDGAACNNDLDVLEEMRLAALLQGARNGPGSLPAVEALEMATLRGAEALGFADELGSLEPGKAGDLVVLDLDHPRTVTAKDADLYTRIVYGLGRDQIRWVVVDGEVLVENGELQKQERARITARAREEADALLDRADL